MSYQHAVKSLFGDPSKCMGYPPTLVRKKPEHEVNFMLTTKQRGQRESNLACSLASREGITLEQLQKHAWCLLNPGEGIKAKPVVIICHGNMSWRNQMLLTNVSSELLKSLDAHILRFDFTGNGHSMGGWAKYNYERDYEDLRRVIDFVNNSLGCQLKCIIGHSKGAAGALEYASNVVVKQELELEKDAICKCFVNLSGWYSDPKVDGSIANDFNEDEQAELYLKGYVDLRSPWGGDKVFKATLSDLSDTVPDTAEEISYLTKNSSVRVLTIHGEEDEGVPVKHAYRFDKEIANHKLHVIPKARHNYNGLMFVDEITSEIASFYKSVYGIES